jgi:hypothetical protein
MGQYLQIFTSDSLRIAFDFIIHSDTLYILRNLLPTEIINSFFCPTRI